ncbi:hypothetical protein B0H16DRAFT_363106 [Mycena metata]|uniref:Transmembrane protein n=1 Tax=Mycena metata TaxID=1033252 RepID=A0AAD7MKV1_9AGAR|nr:hypothetical protein B0H16DRAFT_363106 [Mycena metata]
MIVGKRVGTALIGGCFRFNRDDGACSFFASLHYSLHFIIISVLLPFCVHFFGDLRGSGFRLRWRGRSLPQAFPRSEESPPFSIRRSPYPVRRSARSSACLPSRCMCPNALQRNCHLPLRETLTIQPRSFYSSGSTRPRACARSPCWDLHAPHRRLCMLLLPVPRTSGSPSRSGLKVRHSVACIRSMRKGQSVSVSVLEAGGAYLLCLHSPRHSLFLLIFFRSAAPLRIPFFFWRGRRRPGIFFFSSRRLCCAARCVCAGLR